MYNSSNMKTRQYIYIFISLGDLNVQALTVESAENADDEDSPNGDNDDTTDGGGGQQLGGEAEGGAVGASVREGARGVAVGVGVDVGLILLGYRQTGRCRADPVGI